MSLWSHKGHDWPNHMRQTFQRGGRDSSAPYFGDEERRTRSVTTGSRKSSGWRRWLGVSSGGPRNDRSSERFGDETASLDGDLERTDLDDDGGHPGLSEDGKRHAANIGRIVEDLSHDKGDLFGQKTTTDGLIAVARVVRRSATVGCRNKTKADVQVDGPVVGLDGLG